MNERFKNKYVKLGITIFASGTALILFYGLINHLDSVSEGISVINRVLSPFIYGIIMAYLLCPIYNLVTRKTYHWIDDKCKNKKKALQIARFIATVISLTVLIGIIGGLLWLVIPEFVRSLVGIVEVMPSRLSDFVGWVEATVNSSKHPEMIDTFEKVVNQVGKNINDWAQNKVLPSIGEYMTQISEGVLVTLKTVMNIVIGLIVCVYFLNSKEKFRAQTKKLILSFSRRDTSSEIFEFATFTNKTFGGFINGKIIDSIIMGILCFIVMTILGLPYTILISTIVGVTNFIPFFGPFIGAIPSAVIILMISPLQAFYFLIMILVLQQIDGNIIGPKILGGTTGLASFWVLFAIIVGGGMFGFVGMVIGVPVFAVFYYYMSKLVTKRLKRRNLPVETSEYEDYNRFAINRKDVQ